MKTILFLLVSLLCSPFAYSQAGISLNLGGTKDTNYLTTVPFEVVKGKLVVNVIFEGNTYKFILDTGAPTSISEALYEKLTPTILAKIPVSDSGNQVDSLMLVSLSGIGFGGLTFDEIPTLVAKNNPVFECFQVDGFIGSNLLRNSVVQFDKPNRKIVLTDDVARLKLNKKTASDMYLDWQSSPIISVRAKQKNKAKIDMLLDTGMEGFFDLSIDNYNTLLKSFGENGLFIVKGVATGSNSMGLFGLATQSTQYRLEIPVLDINSTIFQNVPIETTVGDHSLLGSGIFDLGEVTLDYRNKKFYFLPYPQLNLDLKERRFPLDFVPNDGKLVVGFVWDKALQESISSGDQIIEIDGKNYESFELCDLVNGNLQLLDKKKEQVSVTIKTSKGEVVTKNLLKN
jgi:hypothetical protein